MSKNWYIFKGKHHLGPYSPQDIEHLIKEKGSTGLLLWKEGLKAIESIKPEDRLDSILDEEEELSTSDDFIAHWLTFEEAKIYLEQELGRALKLGCSVEDVNQQGESVPPSVSGAKPLKDEAKNKEHTHEVNILERVQRSYDRSISSSINLDEIALEATMSLSRDTKKDQTLKKFKVDSPPEIPTIEPKSLEKTKVIEPPQFEQSFTNEEKAKVNEHKDSNESLLSFENEGDSSGLNQEDSVEPKQTNKFVKNMDEEKAPPPLQINDVPENPKKNLSSVFVIGLVLMLLTSSFSVYLFNEGLFSQKLELVGLSLEQIERIEKYEATTYTQKKLNSQITKIKPIFVTPISADSIWVSLPVTENSFATLEIKSSEGKTLSLSTLEAKSRTSFIKGRGRFSEFNLIKGTSLKEGFYKYKLFLTKSSLKSRVLKYLHQKKLFTSFSFIKNYRHKLKFEGEFLFSSLNENSFNKKLKDFKTKNIVNLVQPLSYQLEKYQTYLTLVEKIDEQFYQILDAIKYGTNIKVFTKYYQKKVGPILQELILDNNRSYTQNNNAEFEGDYAALIDYGKEVGSIVTNMIDAAKKHGRLNKKIRIQLNNQFKPILKTLRSRASKKILSLEKKIKVLNR